MNKKIISLLLAAGLLLGLTACGGNSVQSGGSTLVYPRHPRFSLASFLPILNCFDYICTVGCSCGGNTWPEQKMDSPEISTTALIYLRGENPSTIISSNQSNFMGP